MKYIIIPLIKIVYTLFILIEYIIEQIISLIWSFSLQLNSNSYYPNYWYRKWDCVYKGYLKTSIQPKNVMQHIYWLFKYGFNGEIKELSIKERNLVNNNIMYKKYGKNT